MDQKKLDFYVRDQEREFACPWGSRRLKFKKRHVWEAFDYSFPEQPPRWLFRARVVIDGIIIIFDEPWFMTREFIQPRCDMIRVRHVSVHLTTWRTDVDSRCTVHVLGRGVLDAQGLSWAEWIKLQWDWMQYTTASAAAKVHTRDLSSDALQGWIAAALPGLEPCEHWRFDTASDCGKTISRIIADGDLGVVQRMLVEADKDEFATDRDFDILICVLQYISWHKVMEPLRYACDCPPAIARMLFDRCPVDGVAKKECVAVYVGLCKDAWRMELLLDRFAFEDFGSWWDVMRLTFGRFMSMWKDENAQHIVDRMRQVFERAMLDNGCGRSLRLFLPSRINELKHGIATFEVQLTKLCQETLAIANERPALVRGIVYSALGNSVIDALKPIVFSFLYAK